ncbi:MAG: NYN domain-containing protein [Cyanobacteria bacterium P01_H01_bin.58]
MNSLVPPPLLLVDGYNIIGAWPQLSQLRDHDSLESARYSLIEALANYSAYQGFQTRIVFDAYTQKHVSAAEVVAEGVSVHYTHFGQTADTCIEKWCAELRYQIRLSQQRLIVATSDRAQKLTVTGYGAEWMSAQKLASEVNATTRNRRKHHRSEGFQRTSKRLSTVLKPGVYNQLKSLRAQLEQ